MTHADRLQMYLQNPRMVPLRFTPRVKMVHVVTNDFVARTARKLRGRAPSAGNDDMALLTFDEAVRFKSRWASSMPD